MTLVLHQTFRYDYPSPIGRLRHRLMVLPPETHGDQERRSGSLDVRGAAVEVVESVDLFGNIVVDVRASRVQRYVEFCVDVVVERACVAGPAATVGPFLEPSRLTEPDAALVDAARQLRGSPSDHPLAVADRINSWVAGSIRYRHDVTSVRTTAAEALALGHGVCQDYAHVMLALCRLCGLPARYVSGHMIGEGGSHAWVEVLVAAGDDPTVLTAVAFDPTNDRRAGLHYLTVAVGRDYGDVAPTSGTYSGPPGGRLTSSKTLDDDAEDLVPA